MHVPMEHENFAAVLLGFGLIGTPIYVGEKKSVNFVAPDAKLGKKW